MEEVLAEEAKEEGHGGKEEEEEEDEEEFAESLPDVVTESHAAAVEAAEPAGPGEGGGDGKEGEEDRGDENGWGQDALAGEEPDKDVGTESHDGGELDPFGGFFLETEHGLNRERGGRFA